MELLDERGYSVDQATEILGIGRSMTYELIANGRLESVKIGRRRIIPGQAIREYWARELAASRAGRRVEAV